MFASGTASFFLAASMKLAAHFENCAACSSSPGTPVITSRWVGCANPDDTDSALNTDAPTMQRTLARRCGDVVEWPTSHSPFVSRPALVTELLATLVRSVEP